MKICSWQLSIALSSINFANTSLAKPDVDHLQIFHSDDGSVSWQVVGDDADKSQFYLLPDYFSIVRTPSGGSGIAARRDSDGALRLTLTWGPRDWSEGSQDALARKAVIQRQLGQEPKFFVLYPELVRFAFDPELPATFAAQVIQEGGDPTALTVGSTWTTTIVVPSALEAKFVRRIVGGAGFTGLVSMRFQVAPVTGVSPEPYYTYTTNLFLGAANYCDVRPELSCSQGGT